MVITPQVIVPTLLAPLIAYRMYRRVRSSFGRQRIQTLQRQAPAATSSRTSSKAR